MEYTIQVFADSIQKHTDSTLANFRCLFDNYLISREKHNNYIANICKEIVVDYRQQKNICETTVNDTMIRLVDSLYSSYCQNIDMYRSVFDSFYANMLKWHRILAKDRALHEIDGHLFNVFYLWSRYSGIGETLHSRLLYFLLSDDELHGQGDKFLIKFLELVGIDNPSVGEWHITAEEGRVDVMLRRENPHSIVIVENKSNWAGDQPNQLYRYWYQNIHHCPEDSKSEYYSNNNQYRIIYLAPNRNKAYSDQTCRRPGREFFDSEQEFNAAPEYLPLTPEVWTFNDELQNWLDGCMQLLDATNHPMREYIRQYKEYCQTL